MTSDELKEEEIKLPSGKELTLYELVKFCYDFSETDLMILFKIIDKKTTIEELSNDLKLSKATISRSLTNLLNLGFVVRNREIENYGVGRPKYTYYSSKEIIESKLRKDMNKCAKIIRDFIGKILESKELNLY
ncbi:MAG: transcriptional regulator [Fervidicoccus fontis]|nr:MAG: transcriptional regulator [Fervidicoccus fontis]